MSIHRGPNIATEGLVFLADSGNHMSYPGSGTSWTDLIDDGVGTMVNITVGNGIFNFNGSTSGVTWTAAGENVATAMAGGGCATAWCRAESDGEVNFGRIYDCGTFSNNKNHAMFVQDESGGLVNLAFFFEWSGINGHWRTTTREIPINEWVYVVANYDSDSTTNDPTLYINGASKAVTQILTPTGAAETDATAPMLIGDNPSNSLSWDGDIAIVSIYNRTLSASEIRQNYNALRGRFGV